MDNFIKVWRFHNAPDEYKALSDNGGDEDWLAFVPSVIYDNEYIGWLEEGMSPAFGCCCIDHIKVADGVVVIGAHA